MAINLSLTLGPVLFHWPADKLRDFYARIADEAPVDTVCLGELVCAKRSYALLPQLPELIERLQAGGKQVILSTLGLVMDRRDRDLVQDIASMEDLLIEANDVTAVAALSGKPHAIGPLLGIYNEDSLRLAETVGATRVCLTAELPSVAIGRLAQAANSHIEIQGFGRMPLALSARCYHARSRQLHKDSCQFACGGDPDGLEVSTVDGTAFLAVNGTQTMSHALLDLSHDLDGLVDLGVDSLRLWPQDTDMVRVMRLYRDQLEGRHGGEETSAGLAELLPDADFANGYLHGLAGYVQTDAALV